MPRLLTIEEASAELGVPKGSLKAAAQEHGFLVKMGRACRINPNDLPELIERCQEKPKDQGCTAARTGTASTSSATTTADSKQQALEIAEELKSRSRDTSRRKTNPPVQPHRIK